MTNTKRWTDALPEDVASRLRNCRTIKSDLPALIAAKWGRYKEIGFDKKGYTKEDALIAVLELIDCNSICIDLTRDEYNDLIN